MTFDEANNIVHAWGAFIEHANGKLMKLFAPYIPELFLPFPKNDLEQAVNIVAEHYHNEDNQDAVKTLQATIPILSMYTDDEKAISTLISHFNDPSWRKTMLHK